MKIPSEVEWQLTKKWNSNLVKFNGQQFTSNPLSLTNFHNASQSASPIGLSAEKVISPGKKGTKRTVLVRRVHKSHNKITKRKNNSNSRVNVSNVLLKRGLNRTAKFFTGLSSINKRV